MRLDKFALVVMLTLIIGGAAFYLSKEESEQREDQDAGIVFLNTLSQKLNDVAAVKILETDKETNLKFQGEQWSLQEKNNYPADFSKVKKMLLDLSQFKTIESKTSKPESYGRLGVQNIGEPGDAASQQIELFDKAGNKIESVIIGKSKESRVPGSQAALYVRKSNDAKSWLVSGALRLPTSYEDWLDKNIVDIKADRVKSVSITHPDSSKVLIAKDSNEDKNYKVLNLPDNAKLKSDSIANSLASGLQSLTFVDITPRTGFNMGDAKPTVIEFETFDGIGITVKAIEKDDKHYFLFDSQAKVDDDKARQEAVRMGSHFAKWVYEVAEFKATSLKKTLDDLIAKEDNE